MPMKSIHAGVNTLTNFSSGAQRASLPKGKSVLSTLFILASIGDVRMM